MPGRPLSESLQRGRGQRRCSTLGAYRPIPGPRVLTIVLSCGLLTVGCGRKVPPAADPFVPPWSPAPKDRHDPVVARVAGTPIHASELRDRMARTGAEAHVALDALIAEEVLAVHARDRGIRSDPELRLTIKRALVDKLVTTHFEPETMRDKLPDEAVRPLYERARHAYVHPDIFEVGVITLLALPIHGPARRAAARAQARALEQRLRSKSTWTEAEFKALTEQPDLQDKHTLYTRITQDAEGPFSGDVARAIRRLKAEGAVTPVIENERGFHAALCLKIIPAKNISFEQAREELADAFYPRWRSQQFIRFADQAAQRFGLWLSAEANALNATN